MMDPQLKKDWIAALRSGKYPQGVLYLRYRYADGKEEFCCLGVLCDIAGVPWSAPEGEGEYGTPYGSDLFKGPELPFGLTEEVHYEAYNRNDGASGFPQEDFLQIADWLEGASI